MSSWLWLIGLGWLGTAIIPGGEGGMSPLDGRTAEPSSCPAPSAADADALAAVGAKACNVGAVDGRAAAGDAVARACALRAASESRVQPSTTRRVPPPTPQQRVRAGWTSDAGTASEGGRGVRTVLPDRRGTAMKGQRWGRCGRPRDAEARHGLFVASTGRSCTQAGGMAVAHGQDCRRHGRRGRRHR